MVVAVVGRFRSSTRRSPPPPRSPGGALPDDLVALYRPRRPRDSPLFRLVDAFYDEVKGHWEEHFERRYGFWRGSVEDAV
ncbi:MAG TPA: hypothetical protein VMS86_16105, partial [Thermoanaerobaculia bacterium]|nr:hypothetical protein [Thermoanaerobaculia bacterium]